MITTVSIHKNCAGLAVPSSDLCGDVRRAQGAGMADVRTFPGTLAWSPPT